MTGQWYTPIDPSCPKVVAFDEAFYGDPMTDYVPSDVVGDIVDGFEKKHRAECRQCQEYGLENIEAHYG